MLFGHKITSLAPVWGHVPMTGAGRGVVGMWWRGAEEPPANTDPCGRTGGLEPQSSPQVPAVLLAGPQGASLTPKCSSVERRAGDEENCILYRKQYFTHGRKLKAGSSFLLKEKR